MEFQGITETKQQEIANTVGHMRVNAPGVDQIIRMIYTNPAERAAALQVLDTLTKV